jgi:hypothetical protein
MVCGRDGILMAIPPSEGVENQEICQKSQLFNRYIFTWPFMLPPRHPRVLFPWKKRPTAPGYTPSRHTTCTPTSSYQRRMRRHATLRCGPWWTRTMWPSGGPRHRGCHGGCSGHAGAACEVAGESCQVGQGLSRGCCYHACVREGGRPVSA